MTAVGEHAATLMDGNRPIVYEDADVDLLIDTILAQNGEHHVYAQDMRPLLEQRKVAKTVLVVMVLDGWAGAYYRGDRRAWITRTPEPSPEAPDLLFDPYTGSTFPPNAVIRIDQLRPIVGEYLTTGKRPTCAQWQEPDRYLVY